MMAITLKSARINAGFSRTDAAKKLGISVSTLYNYEKGIRFPNVKIIRQIEAIYGVNYNNIIFCPQLP